MKCCLVVDMLCFTGFLSVGGRSLLREVIPSTGTARLLPYRPFRCLERRRAQPSSELLSCTSLFAYIFRHGLGYVC